MTTCYFRCLFVLIQFCPYFHEAFMICLSIWYMIKGKRCPANLGKSFYSSYPRVTTAPIRAHLNLPLYLFINFKTWWLPSYYVCTGVGCVYVIESQNKSETERQHPPHQLPTWMFHSLMRFVKDFGVKLSDPL